MNCLVISDDNEVTLLRHYRHGIDDFVLEIVGGGVDDNETLEAAIRRELEEEIGLKGTAIHHTGSCYANPSNQTNKPTVLLPSVARLMEKRNSSQGLILK